MDCQATVSFGCTPSDLDRAVGPDRQSWPAQGFQPSQRRDLAIQALAGTETISELARRHEVSRKFLYQQVHTAEQALDQAFAPTTEPDDVLFYLPVTKAWIRQLVLALVLICHSSYRGVIELLRDLFDTPIALGTVHNIVRGAVPQARWFDQQYDLATIDVGAHDEIFQADAPVLVGVDTASTFCYLLSLEEHRDAETWGLRLLELADRGFAPRAIIADGGSRLRAGQGLALPTVPCWGDLYHLFSDLKDLVRSLERRAYKALEAYEDLRHKRARHARRGGDLRALGRNPNRARAESDAAIALHDDIALLLDWLRRDVLAVAGPCAAERLLLYDFIVAEIEARGSSCSDRIGPIVRSLRNHRDDFLAFARALDEGLDCLGEEFQLAPELLRRALPMMSRDDRDPRRWAEEQPLRAALRGRFFEVCEAVAALGTKTIRASSLAENLNSRLRNYFFLRRHLGADYLSLLKFFLNHRRLERSDRPERVGRSPAELLTGQSHPHWLHLLGYTRFSRS
jgi:hypothetical protein